MGIEAVSSGVGSWAPGLPAGVLRVGSGVAAVVGPEVAMRCGEFQLSDCGVSCDV